MDCSLPGSCLQDFSGKVTRVGCHTLLQGIFLTQGSNPHLLHWQADSLVLSHQGSPGILIAEYFLYIHTLIPTSSLPSTYKYIKNTSTHAYFSLPRNVLHQTCNPHSLPTFKSKLSNTYTPTIRQLYLTLEFTTILFTPTLDIKMPLE